MPHDNGLQDLIIIELIMILLQNRQALSRCNFDIALGRLNIPRQQPQKG